MDHIVHRVLRFDRFALDLTRGCLRTADQDIDLRPKAIEVLRYLAENLRGHGAGQFLAAGGGGAVERAAGRVGRSSRTEPGQQAADPICV